MIRTPRLRLIPATVETLTAELDGRAAFERRLGLRVPEDWPPERYDRDATAYVLARLTDDPDPRPWWLHYIVLEEEEGPVVAGLVGYKGPPDTTGTVEVGYGVLPAFRRRGIATEATRKLVARAFAHVEVRRVVAETYPTLRPSIRVLTKCGFRFVGAGSEAGLVRFELTREACEHARAAASG